MLAALIVTLCLSAVPTAAPGALGSHTWRVNEVFSNASGTVQFVELVESNGTPNEVNLAGKAVTAAATGMSFTFPANLPVGSSANRSILLGTAAFAALPGAPPVDHTIPDGFFDVTGDTLQWHVYAPSVLSFGAGQLPLDGACSLSQSLAVQRNSPTNFAGTVGHVDLSAPAAATPYQGSTPGSIVNPDQLAATPAVIGQTWTATVTPQAARAGTPGFDVAIVLVHTSGAPASTFNIDLAPIVVGFGSAPPSQVLITGPQLTNVGVDLNGPGVPSTPGVLGIPASCGLIGQPWFAQAVVLGDVTTDGVADLDPMFTNGVSGTIGSQ